MPKPTVFHHVTANLDYRTNRVGFLVWRQFEGGQPDEHVGYISMEEEYYYDEIRQLLLLNHGIHGYFIKLRPEKKYTEKLLIEKLHWFEWYATSMRCTEYYTDDP